MKVTIVDYGIGNMGSVENMLTHLGFSVAISSSSADILNSDSLILPGVGKFDHGVESLRHHPPFFESLNHAVLEKKIPVLGICLGMQLMCKSSEEGSSPGLAWINAVVKRFPTSVGKIPHMGWKDVSILKNTYSDLTQRFYFVHSYYVCPENAEEIWMKANHSIDFVSAFQVDNITGVQFHPEKSHRYGMEFFKNYFKNLSA